MRKKIEKIMDVISQLAAFVLAQYLLACFYLSFTAHIFSILLLAGNAYMIQIFWENLSRITENRAVKCGILAAGILATGAFLLIFGYFPVAGLPEKI